MKRIFAVAALMIIAISGVVMADEAEVQEITVNVGGKYEPAKLTVQKDRPVRISFIRPDAKNCGGKVVFPELGIERDLPVGETVVVELTPEKAGTFQFTCGMGMMKGSLVVTAE